MMGWPKKNEGFRLYLDKPTKGAYLLIDPESHDGRGDYSGIGEVLIHNDPEQPALASTNVSRGYIADHWLKRVSWNDLPKVWQDAFREWIVLAPECYRGLWRMNEQPKRCVCERETYQEKDRPGICAFCGLPLPYGRCVEMCVSCQFPNLTETTICECDDPCEDCPLIPDEEDEDEPETA